MSMNSELWYIDTNGEMTVLKNKSIRWLVGKILEIAGEGRKFRWFLLTIDDVPIVSLQTPFWLEKLAEVEAQYSGKS